MIQLYLDGHPAIPKDNQTIKFTSENPYFTKSASYTYDVELPLAIEANRKIFGDINRMDMPKEQRIFQAALIVDNVTVLSGTAHITSVSESAVKVQLLGEAASYNYGNKMDETYIDELDLGDWYMVTWPDGSYWGGYPPQWCYFPKDSKFSGLSDMVFERAKMTDDGLYRPAILLNRIYNGTYPWVAFPVINSNADVQGNGFAFKFTSHDLSTVEPFFRGYDGEVTQRPTENPRVSASCIQPFFWIVAELIAKATGFTLNRTDNALLTNAFFKRIFIVNANNMIECNKCLPHWTVNDFWSQIEHTFGLVMTVDYAGKKIFLRQRANHYRDGAYLYCVDKVVDEFTAEVDDESEADISVNNVGYADFDANPADLLDKYITENCKVNTDFAGITELLAWAKANEDSIADYKDTIFKCADGRQFIHTDAEGIIEVNQLRPRITDEGKEDIDVELKIVPACFVDGDCDMFNYQPHGPGGGVSSVVDKPVASFPVRILQIPDISDMEWYKKAGYGNLDIEAILNEEEEAENSVDSKEDKIFISIMPDSVYDEFDGDITCTDGMVLKNMHTFFPRPRIRERMKAALSDSAGTREDAPYSLSLIPIEGEENLAMHTIANAVTISTKVRQCIKFVSDCIPDPSSIFLIHNRRFVCEKIEADISSSGLNKLLTGYFYELDL